MRPAQAPENPSKFQPTDGVAVSLTRTPRAKSKLGAGTGRAAADAGRRRVDGAWPVLLRLTAVTSLKLGDTETLAAGILNVQVLFVEPAQAPPVQLTKRLPTIGVALSTTVVPKFSVV